VLYEPLPAPVGPKTRPGLALLCVAAIPYARGYDVKIFTWYDGVGYESELLQECRDALCVGITTMTGPQITDGLRVAQLVKDEYPDLPIVWGGWHPSLRARETVESPYVDIVVRGQGERTFAELVEILCRGRSLDSIAGVTYKADGEIVENPARPFEDINNFPPLPFELIGFDKLIYNDDLIGSRTIQYVTSYGCPFRCGFCCNQAVTRRRWSGWSADRVLGDIERLNREQGINGFEFVDSNFFVNKVRAKRIFDGIVEAGLKIRIGGLNGRTRQLADLNDELWELMEAAGVKSLLVGTESGCQEALDYMSKDCTVEDALRFARKCRKYNIGVVFANLAGLPWDDALNARERYRKINTEIRETIGMLDQMHRLDPRHHFLFFLYLPYPGTPLYNQAVELGFEPPSNLASWGNFNLAPGHTPWVKKKQEKLIAMLADYIFVFLSSYSEGVYRETETTRPSRWGLWLAIKFFRGFVKARWRFKFFRFPLDYYLYLAIRRLRVGLKGLVSVTAKGDKGSDG
jgi:radical SAM superfamily enzyme YgiQ (UPF0313 family)